jgi:hypothetical protein
MHFHDLCFENFLSFCKVSKATKLPDIHSLDDNMHQFQFISIRYQKYLAIQTCSKTSRFCINNNVFQKKPVTLLFLKLRKQQVQQF